MRDQITGRGLESRKGARKAARGSGRKARRAGAGRGGRREEADGATAKGRDRERLEDWVRARIQGFIQEVLEEGRQMGASVSEVCRRRGISTAQYYQWEKQARDAVLERFQPGTLARAAGQVGGSD